MNEDVMKLETNQAILQRLTALQAKMCFPAVPVGAGDLRRVAF